MPKSVTQMLKLLKPSNLTPKSSNLSLKSSNKNTTSLGTEHNLLIGDSIEVNGLDDWHS